MLALLKRNFLLYFRNRSGVFFSLLGALISFILYIIFLQKNLIDAWDQLPNSGPLLNNWLMSGTLAVTGITTSLAALTQLVKDRERQVDQDLYLSNHGKWRLPFSYLASAIIISFAMQVLTSTVTRARGTVGLRRTRVRPRGRRDGMRGRHWTPSSPI